MASFMKRGNFDASRIHEERKDLSTVKVVFE